jgi:hypothetical protein
MADTVTDLVLPILVKLQEGQARLEQRLDQIDETLKKHRRDSAGMLVMMRATAGDFDERVTELEERMNAFDKRQ